MQTVTLDAATATNCNVAKYMDQYINRLNYGLDCPEDIDYLEKAKEAYLIYKYATLNDCTTINNDLICLYKEEYTEDVIGCPAIKVIDTCFNEPDIDVTCTGGTNITALNSGIINGTITSDVLEQSRDGGVTFTPFDGLIADDCTITSQATQNIVEDFTLTVTPNTFVWSHNMNTNDLLTFRSYVDSADNRDVLTFHFSLAGTGDLLTITNYKYKLNVAVSSAQIIIFYDASDISHPTTWCPTRDTIIAGQVAAGEATWTTAILGNVYSSVLLSRQTIEESTGLYSIRRTVTYKETCNGSNTDIVQKNYTYNQDVCGDFTLCTDNNTVDIIDVNGNIGDVINLFSYTENTRGFISAAAISPNTIPLSNLNNGVLTTSPLAEGLYILVHTYDNCSIDYLYVYLNEAFDVDITHNTETLCPGEDFIMDFTIDGGTPDYTIRYTINGTIIKEVITSTSLLVIENFTQDTVLVIESITDSEGNVANITGQTTFNIIVSTTDTSSIATTAQTYNTTNGTIDWDVTVSATSAVSVGDSLIITIKDNTGSIMSKATFTMGVDTLQNPTSDDLNWTGISPYLIDNPVTNSTTVLSFDKFNWAIQEGKVGINMGETLLFFYDYIPVDACLAPSDLSQTIGVYKSPSFFYLVSGTFGTSTATCGTGTNYDNGYFGVLIKGIGNQTLSPYMQVTPASWVVTNDFIYDDDNDGVGDTCDPIGGFGTLSPADFAPQSWDINTPFTYTLDGVPNHTGLGVLNGGTANESLVGVYTSVFSQGSLSNSRIFNTESIGLGGYGNAQAVVGRVNVGTNANPVEVSFNAPLNTLPNLEANTQFYVNSTDRVLIPRTISVIPVNSNTFQFTFQIATGNASIIGSAPNIRMEHPFAVTDGTATVTNPITYNVATISIGTLPNAAANTGTVTNWANIPITYTNNTNGSIIAGGHGGPGLAGINEVVTQSFGSDGIYNVELNLDVSLSDGNNYLSFNKSQILIISF